MAKMKKEYALEKLLLLEYKEDSTVSLYCLVISISLIIGGYNLAFSDIINPSYNASVLIYILFSTGLLFGIVSFYYKWNSNKRYKKLVELYKKNLRKSSG